MNTLITGHEADIAAIDAAPAIPMHTFRLRIRRDNSPAELAHPGLPLGWQADGSVVIQMTAGGPDRADLQFRMLNQIYRFGSDPWADWIDAPPKSDFRFTEIGWAVKPGTVRYLGISE